MQLAARHFGIALVCYVSAWILSFMALVGFEPSLAPQYFELGWSFSGLELPAFVWLLSWPVFALLCMVTILASRRMSSRKRAV